MNNDLKAPFPWFGGKRKIGDIVWDALGDVDNYVEPFAGSLAVLLERPKWHRQNSQGAETVNDADQFLANFWRALQHDPEGVAYYCDWPVNEADLFARHLWLVNGGRERIVAMASDPDFYDVKVAGWWVWGLCSWIGMGWCTGTGPHTYKKIGTQLPHAGDNGQGVKNQRPHLGNAGQGINRQLPNIGDSKQNIAGYLSELSVRLRNVRVCCGDWSRVVTKGATNYGSMVGVFLDPPYLGDVRTSDLYAVDDHNIANGVREWAITNGNNPKMRIILCGLEREHEQYMPETWKRHHWKASSSYQNSSGKGQNSENRKTEMIWLSPACIDKTIKNKIF